MQPLALIVLALTALFSAQSPAQQSPDSWRFAVSGDSRNCGDVVMPAIAQSVIQNQARFYWHLGDFRAMYDVDEDIQQRYGDKLNLAEYRQIAWGDFIASQIRPFEPVPVRLGIGNRELVAYTRADYLSQFGYWLDTPELREQRMNEYSQNGSLKTYYHWKERKVDFIYLDNAGDDAAFDDAQIQWFEHVLARDKEDDDVRTVVVGMHRALPNSFACGHSMNGDKGSETPNGIKSGRRAYTDLLQWRQDTKNRKFVYILASHSHFYLEDLYDTKYWQNRGEVLPGWIVGTAGAKRYMLPDNLPPEIKSKAKPDVWGYLLGTVAPSGEIKFDFVEVGPGNLPPSVHKLYGDDFIDRVCVKGNKDPNKHDPPPSCNEE